MTRNLILFDASESAFDSNGIGILRDAIDAEVYEVLNGQFEMWMQYPVGGIHYDRIAADCYILAQPNPAAAPQPFRIYRITKPMRGIVTVYARHMAYRLKKIVCQPVLALGSAGIALRNIKASAVNDCPFKFETDVETEGFMIIPVPRDIWSLLGSDEGCVLDVYGGEYEFDRFTVRLLQRRGEDRGVSIRYGKNLTSYEQDENIANVYTGVYPYWINDADGVQLPEYYISAEGDFAEEKILVLDLSGEFEAKPTAEQLREATLEYMASHDIGKPTVSITVEFVPLEQTEEYKALAPLEQVLLGDTVQVFFPKLGVNASARAVAARYKPLSGRYKNVTFGSIKPNLAKTVAKQQKKLNKVEVPAGPQNEYNWEETQ